MNAFTALVWNGFREARRNRVTVVVGAFAVVVLLSSTFVTEVTVSTFERVLTDFGLGMMSLILAFLAIFLSSGLLSREIERRTIFLIVSKPVSRVKFLVARLMGNMLTLGVLLLAMVAIFCLQFAFYGLDVTRPQMLAAGALWFELLVLSSAGFLLSSFAGQATSAIVTAGLYFAGHLSGDIYTLATRSESSLVRVLGKAIYYLLPNLDRINYRPMAAYNLTVPWTQVVPALAYSVAYSTVLIVLASLVFKRRDFR